MRTSCLVLSVLAALAIVLVQAQTTVTTTNNGDGTVTIVTTQIVAADSQTALNAQLPVPAFDVSEAETDDSPLQEEVDYVADEPAAPAPGVVEPAAGVLAPAAAATTPDVTPDAVPAPAAFLSAKERMQAYTCTRSSRGYPPVAARTGGAGTVYTYSQSTGIFTIGGVRHQGYAGQRPPNSPSLERVSNRGPPPRGSYTLSVRQPDQNSATKHCQPVFRMNPNRGTNMYGRDGFLIHDGDFTSPLANRRSSAGCIILPKSVRMQIKSGATLNVLP